MAPSNTTIDSANSGDRRETLRSTRIAILATDGFEQVELLEPKRALEQAGATTLVVSPKSGEIKGWNMTDWGEAVTVDLALNQTSAVEFDALLLPGGVMNPDKLRIEPRAVQFVREFFEAGKPVAAICHGPWLLIEADVIAGRTLTSWPSLHTDIRNAGGHWVDQQVVTDRGLVTSRKPDDLPAFCQKIIEEFAEGINPTHIKAQKSSAQHGGRSEHFPIESTLEQTTSIPAQVK